MSLQVLPATIEDIPRLASIIFEAFTSDALHVAMFPREHQASYMDWYHQKLRMTMEDPAIRTVKVVQKADATSEDDVIIAYGRYQFPSRQRGIEEQPKSKRIQEQRHPFPAKANESLVDYYIDRINMIHKRLVDERKDFVCQMLATHPDYQGRGAGRLLIQYGIDAAKDFGHSSRTSPMIFLEAAPEAYSLYKKFGWRDVDRIDIQLEEYGVQDGGLHSTICMERRIVEGR